MKKLFALLVAMIMLLSLAACGDKGGSTDGGAAGVSSDGGSKTAFNGKYEYNPPEDNYYIRWDYYDADGNLEESSSNIYARIGQGHTETMEYGIYHASDDMQKYYSRAWDGEWMLDPGYGYTDWKTDYDEYGAYIGECDSFEEYFMNYFRAYGFEDEKLAEYYVGTEEVAGIDCWVFDSKGLNAIYMKYWIDPATGCTLKVMDTESPEDGYAAVSEFNLNYTEWTDNLAPASYEGIE